MGLFSKGAEAIILVDVDGSAGMPFQMIPSQFDKEKYIYKGDEKSKGEPERGTVLNVVANKINLITHKNGNPKFDLTNQEKLLFEYKTGYVPCISEDEYWIFGLYYLLPNCQCCFTFF